MPYEPVLFLLQAARWRWWDGYETLLFFFARFSLEAAENGGVLANPLFCKSPVKGSARAPAEGTGMCVTDIIRLCDYLWTSWRAFRALECVLWSGLRSLSWVVLCWAELCCVVLCVPGCCPEVCAHCSSSSITTVRTISFNLQIHFHWDSEYTSNIYLAV